MLPFMRKELGCLFLIVLVIICIVVLIGALNFVFSINYEEVRLAFVDWYNNLIDNLKNG